MRDFLSIGCSPAYEDCVQVGCEDYAPLAKKECYRFIELIRKHCGEEPFGAYLAVKSFPHDFGSYYEVVCYFDDTDNDAIRYAFDVENNAPCYWE